jgi:2-phospho-L-lactate guanylyltransferase (CobY/MobA/RfbA family)
MVKSELAGPTQKVVVKSERSAQAHQAATNASDTMVKSELTGPIEKVVVKSELPALADEAVNNAADGKLEAELSLVPARRP